MIVSNAAQTIPTRTPPKQIERMAWAIVWFAFTLFCALCVGTTVAVYAFLFYSVAPLNVEAQVGKGTVVISSPDAGERGERERENLTVRPAQMSTDALSQATLVVDTQENDTPRFVAAITLKNNSNIILRRASRPRFDWSSGRYEIEFSDLMGDIEVVVGDMGARQIWIQIVTRRGETVTLTKSGRYAISVSDWRVQVVNRRGEAILAPADGTRPLLLPSGQDGLLLVGRSPVTSLQRVNLIDYGQFIFDALNVAERGVAVPSAISTPGVGESATSTPQELNIQMPLRWGCANAQKDLPSGAYTVSEWEGRTALHLVRENNATTNGETRCKQPYAEPGADLAGYTFLELETTFLIHYQSISECGIEGSECPLMIHIVYTDTNGVTGREWYQGFYATLDPLYESYKPRCASCTQDHQQINQDVWYTYESGNLFTILPAEARPAKINRIEFYASGHQYNVYVGEISLFAGYDNVMLPDSGAPIGATPTAP